MSSVTKYLADSSTARDLLRSLSIYGIGHWHELEDLINPRLLPIYLVVADALHRVGLIRRVTFPGKRRDVLCCKITASGWLHLQRVDHELAST